MNSNSKKEILFESKSLKLVQTSVDTLSVYHKADNGFIFDIGYHESQLPLCEDWGECSSCSKRFDKEFRKIFFIIKLIIPK